MRSSQPAAARDAIAARLAEADLDTVPVPEAIARIARVVAAGGSKYDAEQQIKTMIQALVQRGIDDGTFRGDLSVGELLFLLGSLLPAAARMTAEHQAGVEKAAALITSVFLHGTENRQGATAGDRAIRRHAEAGPQKHSNQEYGNPPDKTQG
jgi:TetR/AcrR family transcriptional regulator, mexCD-oprJ operon repressor